MLMSENNSIGPFANVSVQQRGYFAVRAELVVSSPSGGAPLSYAEVSYAVIQ